MSEGLGIPGFAEGGRYSGLPQSYKCTVTDAFFAPDKEYREGSITLLHLKGRVWDVVYQDEEPDDPMTDLDLKYPVGKGESSYDGGRTIQRKSGNTKLDSSTILFRFITALGACGIGDALRARGSAREARVYVGLSMEMVDTRLEFGVGRDGQPIVSNRPMPVRAWFEQRPAAPAPLLTEAAQTSQVPAYREGDEVNGYRLTGGAWVPVPTPAPAPPASPSPPPPPPAYSPPPAAPPQQQSFPTPPPVPTTGPPPAPSPGYSPAFPAAPSPTPSSTNGAPGPLGSQLGSFFPRALELARSTVGQDQGHYRFIDLAFKDPGYSPAIQTALMNPDLYAELVSP